MADEEKMTIEVVYRGGPWDGGSEKLKADASEVYAWQATGLELVNDGKKTIGGLKPEPDGMTHIYGFVPTDPDGGAMGNAPWPGDYGRFAYIGHQEPEPEPQPVGGEAGGGT